MFKKKKLFSVFSLTSEKSIGIGVFHLSWIIINEGGSEKSLPYSDNQMSNHKEKKSFQKAFWINSNAFDYNKPFLLNESFSFDL